MPPTASGSGSVRVGADVGCAERVTALNCAIGTRIGSPRSLVPAVTGIAGGTGGVGTTGADGSCRDHQPPPLSRTPAGVNTSSARTGTGRAWRGTATPGGRPATGRFRASMPGPGATASRTAPGCRATPRAALVASIRAGAGGSSSTEPAGASNTAGNASRATRPPW